MKYHQLKTIKLTKRQRVGRGISAGRGKTAGRGTKGQGARAGSTTRPGFEGGQMPLYMRLPHLRGFKSNKLKAEAVYTGQLNQIKKAVLDANDLAEVGLISSPYANVKLLVKGELHTKKHVKLPAASQAAIEVLQKAGGEFTRADRRARPAKQSTKKPAVDKAEA